jgi:ubiquinone/menaquinone biosynthesis C-methylase UbiE
MSDTTTSHAPNHHRDHPGFSGLSGALLGLTMAVGRRELVRLALDRTEVTSADRVVDVGCGPGTAARAAARRGATVTGVDPAPVMRTLAGRLTRPRLSVTWADGVAEALPLADGAATVLWAISTVHHWPDVEGGLAEAHRVLEPGGRLLVIERRSRPGATGLASHGWTDEQVAAFADQCRAAGFTGVRTDRHRGRRSSLQAAQATRP